MEVVTILKSTKSKDKACHFFYDFFYVKDKIVKSKCYWTCEERGICKGKLVTKVLEDGNHLPVRTSGSHIHPPSSGRKIAGSGNIGKKRSESGGYLAKLIPDQQRTFYVGLPTT